MRSTNSRNDRNDRSRHNSALQYQLPGAGAGASGVAGNLLSGSCMRGRSNSRRRNSSQTRVNNSLKVPMLGANSGGVPLNDANVNLLTAGNTSAAIEMSNVVPTSQEAEGEDATHN